MASEFDILAINARAKRDVLAGHTVINGCVGTLRDDDHTLLTFTEVKKALQDSAYSYLDYSPLLGIEKFKVGVTTWLFNEEADKILKQDNYFFAATMGGTGAIFSCFKYMKNCDAPLIIPDIIWPNYFGITRGIGNDVYKFEIIKNGKFNFAGLEENIVEILKTRTHLMIAINDPCENPIGYCFSDEEYKKLFSLLEKYNKDGNTVDLLLDIAYIDYAERRPYFFNFINKKHNYSIYLAYSASKSLGVYGIRCGALLCFASSKDEALKLKDQIETITRGTVSAPNHQAIGPVSEVLTNPAACDHIRKEIHYYYNILTNREAKMKDALKEFGIKYLPYEAGFFVTIIVKKDAYEICHELMNEHIFLSPLRKDLIRVGICSLNEAEIHTIIERISTLQKE